MDSEGTAAPSTEVAFAASGAAARELARALGVTRVARVTGLDRTGVEVACAIRPGGHILQICNGKGLTFERAALGALLETAELWAAEHVDQSRLIWGARADLPEAWDAAALGSAGELVAPELWSQETRVAWLPARELHSGAQVLVPAQAVHCPPPGGPLLGPAVIRWSTNGSGAHPQRALALRHALLEAAERDQLARALPQGWTARAVRARMLVPATLPPQVRSLVARIEARGFRAHLFDLSSKLSLAGALLVDLEEGPLPLTAGYACGERPEEALLGALLEAAQSRLTDIHGAREDVAPAEDSSGLLALSLACARTRPSRSAAGMPRATLSAVLRSPIAIVDLSAPGVHLSAPGVHLAAPRVHVVKVVAPSFRLSGLL